MTLPTNLKIVTVTELLRSAELHITEQEALSKKRNLKAKLTYLAGRLAAKASLEEFGVHSAVGSVSGRVRGAPPIWPKGCYGSISHTTLKDGSAVGVAITSQRSNLIGIDIEASNREITDTACKKIFSKKENLGFKDNTERLLAFLSKEAFFKAIYPLAQSELGFKDAFVSIAEKSITVSSDKLQKILQQGRKLKLNFYTDELISLVWIEESL